uniref:Uncharacterized protein n=1 Tax=Tetranychus urticae TaxID=32264 RepID=T1KIG0_TETUR
MKYSTDGATVTLIELFKSIR